MIARLATPEDAPRLKEWLGDGLKSYNFDLDVVFIIEAKNEIVGIFAVRPVQLGHGMKLRDESSPLRRQQVEALMNYASGFGVAARLSEAVFHVGANNVAFQRYLEENFVFKMPGELYTLKLK